jgi:hypothetical protein
MNGIQYGRPDDVEANIDVALSQDTRTLLQRATILDRHSPEYLKSECLVYLIREAGRNGDQQAVSALLPVLLSRCHAILRAKVVETAEIAAVDLREEILLQFSELLARDGDAEFSDELDYYECRFNLSFRTFWLDRLRKEVRRVSGIVHFPDKAEVGEEETFTRATSTVTPTVLHESYAFASDLRSAIRALPPDEHRALVLCKILRYEVESENRHKITAATICGVSGRTIRNRLRRALQKLSHFNEDAWS